MAHPNRNLNDLYQRLSLEEEEGEGLDPSGLSTDSTNNQLQWCIIGRLLIEKEIKFLAMKNVLASVWRPVKGVWIKELEHNLFIFQFFHELDLDRMIRNGPWTFEQNLLVFDRLETGMNPHQVPLFEVDFWVQVYDLLVGYMSEKVGKDIDNFLSKFIEANPLNFSRT